MPHGRFGHMQVAIEISLQSAVEMRFGQVFEVLHVLLKGGIVDEDVEAAKFVDVRSTAASQKAGSATSPAMTIQRRPSASTAYFVFSASSCSLRQAIATSAPSRA